MIAIGEHLAAPRESPIDGLGDANGEALHAASERPPVVRLDDEVQVVRLHAEVHEPEPEALGACPEGAKHRTPQAPVTQARKARSHPQRHVHRVVPRLARPTQVSDAPRTGHETLLRRAGATPRTAPAVHPKLELCSRCAGLAGTGQLPRHGSSRAGCSRRNAM